METKEKKIAIFLNLKNIVQKEMVKNKCNEFREIADIHIGKHESNRIESLGIDIKASYKDYEYVVMINPFAAREFETEGSIVQREAFYIDNFLGSICELEKELELLEKNKFEGMLVSRMDYIKAHAVSNYEKWEDYYEAVELFDEENELRVTLSEAKSPIQVENGCAIIKTKALEDIEKTKHGELSPELLSYLLPVYMQSRGFLPSYFMKKDLLKNNNIGYTTLHNYSETNVGHNLQICSRYYYDFGDGFVENSENEIKKIIKFWTKDRVEFKIPIPNGVKAIQFNPCDGFMCVCAETGIEEKNVKIENVNAQHFEKEDVFLTHKPEYIITGDFEKYDMITITMENISVFWSEHDFKYEIDNYIMSREKQINDLLNDIETLKNQIQQKENKYQQALQEIDMMKQSRSWRYTAWLRKNDTKFAK